VLDQVAGVTQPTIEVCDSSIAVATESRSSVGDLSATWRDETQPAAGPHRGDA